MAKIATVIQSDVTKGGVLVRVGRRQILTASAGFAALATLGGARLIGRRSQSAALASADVQYSVEPAASGALVVRRQSMALGTRVAITAIHDNLDVATGAIDAAFMEIERVESVLSIYRPDSQLSQLNRDGRLERPDRSLAEVLRYAASVSETSGGAFDATVQPLWRLYADARREGRLPSDEQIAAARSKVDWRGVRITDNRVWLTSIGASVTLNGIAQGYAADRALAAAKSAGAEHALIDTGEFAPLGRNRNGEPWSIGIQHPRDGQSLIAVTELAGRCLATSGDYATTFSADRRFNHLFDPRTGKSPVGLASVSILAPTAMEADALSTACFVLGIERAKELIASRKHVDAYFVPVQGESVATAGFAFVSGGV